MPWSAAGSGAFTIPLAVGSLALYFNKQLDHSPAKVGDVIHAKWHEGAFGWAWTEPIAE